MLPSMEIGVRSGRPALACVKATSVVYIDIAFGLLYSAKSRSDECARRNQCCRRWKLARAKLGQHDLLAISLASVKFVKHWTCT